MDMDNKENKSLKVKSGSREKQSNVDPQSPLILDRDGVLAMLGYKSAGQGTVPQPQPSLLPPGDVCQRCQKKVYPVEKIDVGALYHKGCFKCRTCHLQLTLKTFQREVETGSSKVKDVYCQQHVPKHSSAPQDADSVAIRRALDAQKHASSKMRRAGYEHEAHYDAEALEFQHLERPDTDGRRRNKVVRRSSTLTSYKDFEEFGVFDAQTALEKCQREEEDELYRQMHAERGRQLSSLQQQVDAERSATVADLITWFEQQGSDPKARDDGLKKVEQYFGRQRETRQRLLLQRLAMEEQAAVARMIERHCQEMLVLIAEKEAEAERLRTELSGAILEPGSDRRTPSTHRSREGLEGVPETGEHRSVGESPYRNFVENHEAKMKRREREAAEEPVKGLHKQLFPGEDGIQGDSRRWAEEEGREQDEKGRHHSHSESRKDRSAKKHKQDARDALAGEVEENDRKDRRRRTDDSDHHHTGSMELGGVDMERAKGVSDSPSSHRRRRQQEGQPPGAAGTPAGSKRRVRDGGSASPAPRTRDHSVEMEMGPSGTPREITITPQGPITQIIITPRKGRVGDSSDQSSDFLIDEISVPRNRELDSMKGNRSLAAQHPDMSGSLTPRSGATSRGSADSLESLRGRRKHHKGHPSTEHSAPHGTHGTPRDRDDFDSQVTDRIHPPTITNIGPPRGKQVRDIGTPGKSAFSPARTSTLKQSRLVEKPWIPIINPFDKSGTMSTIQHEDVEAFSTDDDDDDDDDDGDPSDADTTMSAEYFVMDESQIHHQQRMRDLKSWENTPTSTGGRTPFNRPPVGRAARNKNHRGTPGTPGEHGAEDAAPLGPEGVPIAVPPTTKKADLYATPEVFKMFDEQAVSEAKRDHATFTDLVRRLSKRCETELQKVRAIFRWITAKDLNTLEFSETLDPESPLGLLRGIKVGTETYHNIFKRLCSYAGLHCVIIDGFSKGVGYRAGQRMRGYHFRNQWTAVWVENAWRFINCNWGSRHVKGPRDDHMTYKCDEFYFLTDPEDHIYQHLPDDPKWQLLSRTLSMEVFIRLPVIKSPFFNLKLQFERMYDSVIEVPEGSAEIQIFSSRLRGYACRLRSKDGVGRSDILRDRVLIRTVDNMAIFVVNLPSPGKYFLDVFVSPAYSGESMDHACAFQLRCSGVSPDAHMSFPPVGTFGKTPRSHKYGITELSHRDPYIVVSDNKEQEISFILSRDIKLSHSLKFWNHRDRKLIDQDKYSMIIERTDREVHYRFCFARRGNYAFSVYATGQDRTSSEIEGLFRYLFEVHTSSQMVSPCPKASKRWKHCRLIDPPCGELKIKTNMHFSLKSAVATEMMVSVNDVWHTLQKQGPAWQGVIYTGEKDGKAIVYGRFDSRTEKYIPLLEYSIKGDTSIADQVRMVYKYLPHDVSGDSPRKLKDTKSTNV